MAFLKIKTDGDPFPAKAGSANTDGVSSDGKFGVTFGSPLNTGAVRGFSDTRTGYNTIIDRDPPKEYKIKYRAGDRDQYSEPSKRVQEDDVVGVAINGVPIYSPLSKIHPTDNSNSGSTFHFNLGSPDLNDALDNCGGRPEVDGEYRYRTGNFCYNGFANGANPNMIFVNSSDYISSSSFGSDYLRHDTIEHDNTTFTAGHSKIIGWALDGFPIYGPYGYYEPLDPTSSVVQMISAYGLRDQDDPILNHPERVSIIQGIYVEDYELKEFTGTLDAFNGRYCVTPDFKEGTYAYFLTFDEVSEDEVPNNPAYPYVVGPVSKQPRSQ